MPRTQVALFVVSSLFTLVLSCGDRGGRASPASADPPVPAGTQPASGRLSIVDRLGREAQTRPTAPVRAEAVADALAARGLPLERWKQVLASPIGARFCMAGQTAAGCVVAVCEFGNEAEANAGLDYSHQTFDRLIPNRSLLRRGQTVLTVTRPPGAPVPAGQADHVAQIFSAL
jgi:hypothetical protein